MQQTVESNRTLLIDGPASVRLTSGKAQVFGYQIKEHTKVLVREGKRLPFYTLENTVFDIALGANAGMQEVVGNTVPASWNKPVEAVLELQKKPVVVMLIGQADVGKSSFCTYMVNKLINEGFKVAVLDSDLGQADIGPSGTISYACAFKPITQIYNLKMENAFFVGVTSPVSAMAKTVEAYTAMLTEISAKGADVVVVNTDGWVTGDIALRYKSQLKAELKPDLVVCIQLFNELDPIIWDIQQTPILVIEPSGSLNPRSSEKRKILREMTYTRYLKHAKMRNYPISQLTVEPRSALPKNQEPEKGLLVGLYGKENKFLGIGVLREINQTRKALKVQTSVSAKPTRLVLGKVLLDRKFREIQEPAKVKA